MAPPVTGWKEDRRNTVQYIKKAIIGLNQFIWKTMVFLCNVFYLVDKTQLTTCIRIVNSSDSKSALYLRLEVISQNRPRPGPDLGVQDA